MAKVTSKTKTETYGTTFHIKSQLRDILQTTLNRPRSTEEWRTQPLNCSLPIVVTRRASGKTTALAQFVGERILQLDDSQHVAVLVSTENMGLEFLKNYETFFPLLRLPIIANALHVNSTLRGFHIVEAYIEEVFSFSEEVLHNACTNFPVIAGVGTIEQPTTITIQL